MTLSRLRNSLGCALVLLSALSTGAQALSIQCEDASSAGPGASGPSELTLSYSGEANGTLHVKAAFGELDIPATLATRGEGAAAVTGIRAFGETKALMPDKSALEDCVGANLPADQQSDNDRVFMQRLSCLQTTAIGATPVPITLSVEIATGESVGLYVYLVRTFLESSRIGSEPIKVESIPPPRCTLVDGK